MKHFLKYLLVAGAFVGVLIISEAIYRVNNRPEYLQTFYLILAKREVSSNNIQKSLNFMNKAARGAIDITAKRYPGYIGENYPQVSYDSNNEDFLKEYRKYFENIPSFILIQDRSYYLARIFYDLGLIAYTSGQKELVIYFWQSAILLVPELSHYHVELANFYLKEGNEEQTKNVLEFCLNFKYASEHCKVYRDNNLYWNFPEDVGFLKEEVKTLYNLN